MSVAEMILWSTTGISAITYSAGWYLNKRGAAAPDITPPEAEEIDGRTRREWYEIVKMMGKEECERMTRPALDGLEGSKDGIGGWDVRALVGDELYRRLYREWYPEKFCKYCREECGNLCDETRLKIASRERIERGYGMKPRVNITQIVFRDQPSWYRWRMERDNDSWQVIPEDVRTFQRYKGLVPDGFMGPTTRQALTRYMQAGNSWPVSEARLRGPEAQKLARELGEWKNRDWERNW